MKLKQKIGIKTFGQKKTQGSGPCEKNQKIG